MQAGLAQPSVPGSTFAARRSGVSKPSVDLSVTAASPPLSARRLSCLDIDNIPLTCYKRNNPPSSLSRGIVVPFDFTTSPPHV